MRADCRGAAGAIREEELVWVLHGEDMDPQVFLEEEPALELQINLAEQGRVNTILTEVILQ